MATKNVEHHYQVELVNEKLLGVVYRSETAAKGKLVAPKWVPPLMIIVLILTMLGAAFAMGYFISYPRKSTKPLKLINENCTVQSTECDDSRGLYCPLGQCVCKIANATYDGNNCVCPNLTRFNNQACVGYNTYGQICSLPSIKCVENFICGPSGICTCNTTTQFYNGSYCATSYSFNQPCTQTPECVNSLNLYCLSNRCSCVSNYFWNGSICIPKKLGFQICNNIASGTGALVCDDTLGLSCSANNTCQCSSTMYWDINDQLCETKRLYADICNSDFYCNETLNFICPVLSGTCNCPVLSNDYTCDCRPNWFYDGWKCIPRKSINGTCPGTYACNRNTLLVCFTGLCVCPTPTTWTGLDCTCASGQTWTGSGCAASG